MGCDGGTIPRRDELVRVQKKPEKKDKEAELAFRWKHCAITQLPLRAPIVACGLGRLYSKEAVLEGLLDRSMLPESAKHLKKMKDVKDLNLTPNPEFKGDKINVGNGYIDHGKSPYICPVIGLEMNGKYKFSFIWSCGCVMSERALKEIKTNICHKCQKAFEPKDMVIMNAEGEDLKLMEGRLAGKKSEKKAKRSVTEEAGCSKSNEEEKEGNSKKKIKKEDTSEAQKNGVGKNGGVGKKSKLADPAYKKTSGDYSVAKDPKATEVYKSLFTSHKTAAEQTKAHWVTYNPFYN